MNREIKFRAVLNGREYDVSTRTPLHRDAKGWHKRQGYIVRLTANHPFADKRGYVLEHRLIMEEHLGRFLTDNEVIHHKDGNRTNNELSNLELMDDQKIHAQIEMTGKRNGNGRVVAQDPIFEEIKFRLFNKNTGLTEIKSLSKLIGTTYRRGQFEFRGRFTGLLDKNGVEIYEGDIIDNRGSKYVIVYSKSSFKIQWESERAVFSRILEETYTPHYEVVGNIYENQNLIK